MKEGEDILYKRRIVHLNMWEEYCVCHLWGGMVAYNASFDSLPKAMIYIDTIVSRNDLSKEDFQRIAEDVKRVHIVP